jgi:CHAT domain-containing protein
MSRGRTDITQFLTPGEKLESQNLNRKISGINDLIRAQKDPDSPTVTSLHRQLDSARLQYQFFQNAMGVAHPALRSKTGLTASLTENDANRLGDKANVVYLEYVTTKERVFLFLIGPRQTGGTDLKVYEIGIKPQRLEEKVSQFHQRLANRHPDFSNVARELHTLLIEPAIDQLSNVTTLCIVPDGFLWNLPFQALLSASDRYLIEDRALYYAPSLSVLSEMARVSGSQDKMTASMIAFGNPVIGRDEQRNEEL